MGNRKFYSLEFLIDNEGYHNNVIYFGPNYKAACDRYRFLFNFIKKRHFIDEGVMENDIYQTFREPPENISYGGSVESYLNDQDCYYVTIKLSCVKSKGFISDSMEAEYKRQFPDGKY